MSLKSDLKSELQLLGIKKFSDINKKSNRAAKQAALERVVRRGILEGKSKEKLSKELRQIQINKTKFTFSNQLFRDSYDKYAINPRTQPATALRSTYKPKANKIGKMKRQSGQPLGAYFYIIKAYLKPVESGKRVKTKNGKYKKYKKIPKNPRVVRLTKDTDYLTTNEFVIISEEILTIQQVIRKALNVITGESDEDEEGIESDISFHQSGLNGIDFKQFYMVAFEYRNVVKDF